MSEAVDVVVVSYNTRVFLHRCLLALLAGTGDGDGAPAVRVTVVDNGSTDGSAAMVAAGFPQVALLCGANRGYGAALNLGLRTGNAALVALLNGDAWPAPGALATLCRLLELHPRLGLLGPRVIAPGGEVEGSCGRFPGLRRGPLGLPAPVRHATYASPVTAGGVRPVDWVSGVFVLARRAALAVPGGADGGPFDPGFQMYFEDVDLCWRLARAGWGVGFTDAATVIHAGSASWQGQLAGKRRARDAAQIRYFLKRGQHLEATIARLRRALRRRFTAYYGRDGEAES